MLVNTFSNQIFFNIAFTHDGGKVGIVDDNDNATFFRKAYSGVWEGKKFIIVHPEGDESVFSIYMEEVEGKNYCIRLIRDEELAVKIFELFKGYMLRVAMGEEIRPNKESITYTQEFSDAIEAEREAKNAEKINQKRVSPILCQSTASEVFKDDSEDVMLYDKKNVLSIFKKYYVGIIDGEKYAIVYPADKENDEKYYIYLTLKVVKGIEEIEKIEDKKLQDKLVKTAEDYYNAFFEDDDSYLFADNGFGKDEEKDDDESNFLDDDDDGDMFSQMMKKFRK